MKRWIEAIVFWGAFALLWEYGVAALGVRRYLLPPLSAVVLAGWDARDMVVSDTWVTLTEVLVGFVAAVAGGVLLGMLIHFSDFTRRTLYPFIAALQSMPKIALAPLMIVWFGYGFASKIAATFLFAFFPAVIGAIVGEFIGSEEGLGHLITLATANAKTDLMFAAILVITVLATFLYWIVEVVSRLVWWRGKAV